MTIEIKYKDADRYLSRVHEWVGERVPPGHIGPWRFGAECWYAVLDRPLVVRGGRIGRRWIVAGPDRAAVAAAVARVQAADAGGTS